MRATLIVITGPATAMEVHVLAITIVRVEVKTPNPGTLHIIQGAVARKIFRLLEETGSITALAHQID